MEEYAGPVLDSQSFSAGFLGEIGRLQVRSVVFVGLFPNVCASARTVVSALIASQVFKALQSLPDSCVAPCVVSIGSAERSQPSAPAADIGPGLASLRGNCCKEGAN